MGMRELDLFACIVLIMNISTYDFKISTVMYIKLSYKIEQPYLSLLELDWLFGLSEGNK